MYFSLCRCSDHKAVSPTHIPPGPASSLKWIHITPLSGHVPCCKQLKFPPIFWSQIIWVSLCCTYFFKRKFFHDSSNVSWLVLALHWLCFQLPLWRPRQCCVQRRGQELERIHPKFLQVFVLREPTDRVSYLLITCTGTQSIVGQY